jgi:hypothetical protein
VAAMGLSIKSFGETEAATKRLSGAIQLAGTFTAGATERLSAYATGLMKTTGVSDELIRNLMAQAVAMGRTEEEAKKLATAAVDIAARGIMPLDAAFETLQVTYEGIGIRSKELRAITGDMTEAQLRSGVAVDRVAAAVKGAGAEMRNTTEGAAKNFKNSMDELGESFGAVMAPAFNKLLNTIADLADKFGALDESTKKAIVAGAGVLAIAGPLLIIIPKIVLAVRAMGVAFATSAGPIGLIVTGVALLVAGIVKIISLSKEFAEKQKLIDDAFKGTLKSTEDYNIALGLMGDNLSELQTKKVALQKQLAGEIDTTRNLADTTSLLQNAQTTYSISGQAEGKKRLATLNAEIEANNNKIKQIEKNRNAQTAADKAILNAANAKAKAEADAAAKKTKAEVDAAAADAATLKSNQDIMDSADELEKKRQEAHDKILADENEERELIIEGTRNAQEAKDFYYANVAKGSEEGVDGEKKAHEISLQDWQGYARSVVSIMSTLFAAIDAGNARSLKIQEDAIDQATKTKLSALDEELQTALFNAGLATAATEEQYRKEIAAALLAGDTEKAAELQKSLDTLLIKQTYEDKKSAIEAAAASKKAKLEYDAAVVSWNLKIVLAIADTAAAIVEALPNVFLAAAVGIAGAIQLAAIYNAKPVMPKLAEGAVALPRPGGTQALLAEAGQAEAIIPLDRLDSMLARRGGAGMGSMENIHLTVKIDSASLFKLIFPATRNKQILIDGRAIVSG